MDFYLFDRKRTTCIEQATIDGNLNRVTSLLLATPYINKAKRKDIDNALLQAAHYNREEIMKIFLEHGADVNKKEDPEYFRRFYNVRRSALMIADQRGFTNCVDLLLKYGSKVNKRHISLTRAFKFKCSKIAELLIDQGADIEVKNEYGETTLLMAADGAMGTVMKKLIKMGMNVHAVDPWDNSTALHKLLKNLNVEKLDFDVLGAMIDLIEMGIDINHRDDAGRTPLMIAMTNDFSRINEPNVPASNEDLQQCMAETFKTFLSKCSHLNDGDNDGITPLMLAADNGYEHHVRTLLKLGCHIDQLSNNKWSALRYAVKSSHANTVKLLLENDANLNLVCGPNQGAILEAALHMTCYTYNFIRLLLYHGCMVNLKTLNKKYLCQWKEIDLLIDMYRYGNCSCHSITQWIYSPEFAFHWHSNRAKTSWLLRMCSQPRSLQSSTRLAIRRCTRQVISLPIPQRLKQYLNYELDHDIFDQENEKLILKSDETSPKPDSELVRKEIKKRVWARQREQHNSGDGFRSSFLNHPPFFGHIVSRISWRPRLWLIE